jgi:hypothetical protein
MSPFIPEGVPVYQFSGLQYLTGPSLNGTFEYTGFRMAKRAQADRVSDPRAQDEERVPTLG